MGWKTEQRCKGTPPVLPLPCCLGERFHGPRKAAICAPEPSSVRANSSAGCSVTALPFGARVLPVGENGSDPRHLVCLATPLVRCSRWVGLSFSSPDRARRRRVQRSHLCKLCLFWTRRPPALMSAAKPS